MSKNNMYLIVLVYAVFIAIGMPDGLIGIAWPSMRKSFNVPIDSLGMFLISGTAGYLLSSFFSGRLIAKYKIGIILSASCALTGAVLIGYCIIPNWFMMCALGFLTGIGGGAIDAGINSYVASNMGKKQMHWLHASYGIGVTLGPVIMTASVNLLHSWKPGYITVGVFQIVLALCFVLTVNLWHSIKSSGKDNYEYDTKITESLKQFDVLRSLFIFFVYCGIEGTLGIWTYSILTESRSVSPALAGFWAGSYYAMFTAGRILAGFYEKKISNTNLIFISLGTALAGLALFVWDPFPLSSVISIAIAGFSIAPVFPALVSGTKERVEAKHVVNTIGMQMSAGGLGIALIPGTAGILARQYSTESIPVFLFILMTIVIMIFFTAAKKRH